MSRKWSVLDALGWKTQLGLSIGFAFVLGLSLVLPINDCVVGRFGDVSTVLGTVWTFTTGSATLVSFIVTVQKYRADPSKPAGGDEPTDSPTAIHVESVEGDVDLNVTLSETQREHVDESNASRPSKNDTPDRPDSDSTDTNEKDLDTNGIDEESAE